jgi:hypothetical protein
MLPWCLSLVLLPLHLLALRIMLLLGRFKNGDCWGMLLLPATLRPLLLLRLELRVLLQRALLAPGLVVLALLLQLVLLACGWCWGGLEGVQSVIFEVLFWRCLSCSCAGK